MLSEVPLTKRTRKSLSNVLLSICLLYVEILFSMLKLVAFVVVYNTLLLLVATLPFLISFKINSTFDCNGLVSVLLSVVLYGINFIESENSLHPLFLGIT